MRPFSVTRFRKGLNLLPPCKRSVFTDVHLGSEVEDAIRTRKPIVALESTIISHGMPYPRNKDVALELENIIREAGAIPATTAIINGFCKVGLQKSEIELLVDNTQQAYYIYHA